MRLKKMNKPAFKSIFGKITIRFVIVILLTILVLGFLLTYWFENFYFKNREREFADLGMKVSSLVEESLYLGNSSYTMAYLHQASQFMSGNVLIINKEGLVMAASRESKWLGVRLREEIIQQVLKGQVVSQRGVSPLFDKPVLLVAVPVKYGNNVIGATFVYSPLEGIGATIVRLRQQLIYAGILSLIFAVIISISFARSLAHPLKKMHQVAMAMVEGNFQERVPVQDEEDEIGELAQAINNLAGHLEKNIEALQQEKSKLEYILTGMSEGVIAINQQQEMILLNPAASEAFSVDVRRELPVEITGVLPEHLVNLFHQVVKEERLVRKEFGLDKEGRKQRILAHLAPVYGQGDELRGAVGVFEDITERWKLEQAQKRFVSNVSHELKTPLSSIQGFVKALKDEIYDREGSREEYLGIIQQEVSRLTGLVNDLLDLSQLETGVIKMEMAPFSLADTVERVVRGLTPFINEKELDLLMDW
ncbi:MAG: histidine kinase dimerization/phospho-acceptor domain-containing protein, partial [Halanaerobium sp.]|nr:histidine kinase dimerization/phospho-acceptor domain-containing protein [Halanaerobium sp.]